jgi:hypothetical protein
MYTTTTTNSDDIAVWHLVQYNFPFGGNLLKPGSLYPFGGNLLKPGSLYPFGGNLLKPGSLYFRPTTDRPPTTDQPPTADRYQRN